MTRDTQLNILKSLLLRKSRSSRLWSAWIALCTGSTLLLLSVMIWWNFRELLQGQNNNDSLGSTYITISKMVTDQDMGHGTTTQISTGAIEALKKAPQVQDVGTLTPAAFKVAASLGRGDLNFYTLLFLEAAPERFMDNMPATWQWKEGNTTLPIILSRDFLNMYNYIFAPSQGLPQLSENSVKALGFNLIMGEGVGQVTYRAQVEGFSDRISSVLTPLSFIEYGNRKFANGASPKPSRLILKVADASNEQFVHFLQDNHYTANNEQLRWNKVRAVVEAVSAATGLLAILLMGIGALVFVLFIELTLARARDSVRLLLQLGYSPKMLSRFLTAKFLPVMASALLLAVTASVLLQWLASVKMNTLQLSVPTLPGWPVWLAALLSALLLTWQIRRAVAKALYEEQ